MSKHELKVIGAGWGRTGTMSLKRALEILGYPCYHMIENMKHNHNDFWIRVADGKEYHFNEVFDLPDVQFTATVDYPGAGYWRELLETYPNAKIILTKREPEKWYESCMATIFRVVGGSPHNTMFGLKVCRWLGILPSGEMTQKVISRDAFHDDWGKESILDSYNKHNAAIVAECPADKLLVFEVSEGWGPLCTFLNKPIPDQPFPHVNDRNHMNNTLQKFNMLGWAMFILMVIGFTALGVYALQGHQVPLYVRYATYVVVILAVTAAYGGKVYIKSL